MARRKKKRRTSGTKKPTLPERVRSVARNMGYDPGEVVGMPFGRGVRLPQSTLRRRTRRGDETWEVAHDESEAWLVGLTLPEALEEAQSFSRNLV